MAGLTNTDNVNRPELFDSGEFSTVVIDGTTYLFVTTEGNSFSQFVVGADGRATHVRTVVDDSTLELAGGWAGATAVVGGTTYLFVTGFDDDGLSVFSVGAGGTLTNVDNVTDTATLRLDGPTDLATAVVAGTSYLFAAATEGVSVFSVDASGHLTNVFNISDDATLERPSSVGTAVVGGTTYLFVTNDPPLGGGVSVVSVFSVAANGALTNVDNVADDATLQIDRPFGSTTAVVGGTTYLFVPGATDGGSASSRSASTGG